MLLCGFITIVFLCVSAVDPDKGCVFRRTCMGIQYDPREFVCCGNKLHPGKELSCCGKQAFNPNVATCCKEGQGSTLTVSVTLGLSENVSACCGLKAYAPLNEMCCQSTVSAKPAPMAQCCGNGAYDEKNQLCCGPTHDKKIVPRASNHHQCCGHAPFDTVNQCCCWMDNIPQIQHIHSKCCAENSAQTPRRVRKSTSDLCKLNVINCQSTTKAKPAPNTQYCGKGLDAENYLCCGPLRNKTVLTRKSSDHQCCGHDQYNTKTECCCWSRGISTVQTLGSSCCAKLPGVQLQTPTPQPNSPEPLTGICGSPCYNPNEFQCCDGSQTRPHQRSQRGHHAIFNPLTHNCCDGCVSETKPWTDKFHGSPGQHCCGTELYQPHSEICCDGHRHPKKEHSRCCGIQSYNISDPQMKCCGGTLYNLTCLGESAPDALCCGSSIQMEKDVCCSSADMELLYSAKRGHRCCGHLYFNTSLWSCCAGELSPLHRRGHLQDETATEFTFRSVNNLNKRDLCNEIKIGTVESVSPHSVVFKNVLVVHGTQASVRALPSPYILKTPNCCIFPKLIPGKTYFFDNAEVFTDFNHNSLESVHLFMSMCRP